MTTIIPRRLAELEAEIEAGIRGYERAGLALREIHAADLYRAAGYASFDAYCRDRWGWSRVHAWRTMEAATVAGLLPTGNTPLSERVARELVTVKRESPALVPVVWAKVEALHGSSPTADQVNAVAKPVLREARAAERPPAPATLPAGVTLEVGNATRLPWLDASVDLQITSVPYGLKVAYDGCQDKPEDWEPLMVAWLPESLRVAKDTGRLAVNVTTDTGDGRYLSGDLDRLARAAGWQYKGCITWLEGNASTSTGWGSWRQPSAPSILNPTEVILLYFKGQWERPPTGEETTTRAEFLDWIRGVWTFPGESHPWEDHPAAFPVELPRRLIKLLSYPGDVVADPFMGSGTTPLAAYELGREAWGVDLSPIYVDSARRRLDVAVQRAEAA